MTRSAATRPTTGTRLFEDDGGAFRWRQHHRNGEIIAATDEGVPKRRRRGYRTSHAPAAGQAE